jgi:membrane associated rhomboid family serine protease
MRCYRHPDRETGVSCQRCDRYICHECQLPNAVGVLCPEDGRVPVATRIKNDSRATVTVGLIAFTVLIFVLQLISEGVLTRVLAYSPDQTLSYPWKMLSAGFVHSTGLPFLHLALNMYSLYIFGSVLEPLLGKLRFITLYLFAILGGSVAVLLLESPYTSVIGASGGVFGLMGAYFVILRSLGQRSGQMTSIIAINLVIGFFPGLNISWQAHVGGLLVGGLVALAFANTRATKDAPKQKLYLAGIALALIALTLVGASLLPVIGW